MMDHAGQYRVGIDGFNLALAKGTGIATYARALSHALTGLGHPVDVVYGMDIPSGASDLLREVMFFDHLGENKPGRKPPFPSHAWLREVRHTRKGVDAVPVPITGKVIAGHLRDKLPGFDRIVNAPNLFQVADRYFRRTGQFLKLRIPNAPPIMHWTYPLPILLEGAKNIYTLHDLVPLRLPYTTLDNKGSYTHLIRHCLTQGDHISTVSEASRRDIEDLFPEAVGKVTNTYESFHLPPEAISASDAEVSAQLQGVFGLPSRGYFLFYGSLEPKKNIGRLVEAYLASGVTTPLVIVGAQAWKAEQELRLVHAWQNRADPTDHDAPRIIQIEYVPFSLLMTLIRGAKAVTFPSLYEGFGLPVLEAMSLGTPTLTATTGSLPEIAGDAALMVDPYDVRDIAHGLQRLDQDAELRAGLAARGRVQAARFSMKAFQKRTADLYESVMADHRTAPQPR